MKISRRLFLGGSAMALSAPWISRVQASDAINVASVFDLSGGLEIYGQPVDACLDLAISEINDSGGLLGRQIALQKYDPQSNIQFYTQYATEAATGLGASVVFAGITSASREAIRPILRRYGTPYFYPVLYEGGVCDRNTFLTGSTPAQTIGKLIPYAVKNFGKKVYVLAADYNYGQISTKWVKEYTEKEGGSVVAAEFFPLDATDFSSAIQKIQKEKPDIIYALLVGGSHLSFFRQWAAAGMTNKIPIVSTSFGGGNEHIILTPEESDGIVASFGYFQEIKSPANDAFMNRYKAKFGDKGPYVSELGATTYNAVMHWANGVKKANSVDRLAVIEAIESGSTVEGPGGASTIDPKTHHCATDVYIGKVKSHSFEILESYSNQPPADTAAVCDLVKNPDDNQQYVIQ